MATDFNIPGHINRIYRVILFLISASVFFPLQYNCPINHPTQLGYSHTILTPFNPSTACYTHCPYPFN